MCRSLSRRAQTAGVQFHRGGGTLPSPTSDRSVSGMNLALSARDSILRTHRTIGTRMTLPMTTRNQKIDLQPRLPANTPPSNGPALGPKQDNVLKMPTYFPRSCGRATSEMTPAPTAIVAEAPDDCTMRMSMSSQYALVGHSACPTLANVKTIIVPMKTGLTSTARNEP